MARGSGNRPKAPPPPASRPTVRPPGERKLFFQKLRGSERTVCAPQGQVGKWSRRRRGEEAKGGERGAPLPRQVPALGSCPSVFNPSGRVKGQAKERGYPRANSYRGQDVQLPTHPSLRSPPPGNAGQSWVPGGTRGEGATNLKETLSTDRPSFLQVAHNFKFPPPGMLRSICCGWGWRAAPPPPDPCAPLPSVPASTFCSLLAL